ncbi:MAG: STAS domain-containing protein [Aquihabitans sp.]
MRVTHTQSTPAPHGHRPTRFSTSVSNGRETATVRVSGEIDAASSPELGADLLAAGADGRAVHLDLTDTSFIDSAGIRVLVRSMWDLRERDSELALVAVSPMAENILRITGILDVLKDPAP